MQLTIHTPEELDQAAEQLLAFADGVRVFTLSGGLGAGKTTFVQAICRRLGVEEAVTSPTFGIVNEYARPDGDGKVESVYHLDLYRLNTLDEALDIGVEEYLFSGRYCFIEWPDLLAPILPPEAVRIELEIQGNSDRKILFL